MDIRIIRNASHVLGSVYMGKYMLSKDRAPSEFEGINVVRFFIYDPAVNRRTEILPNILKYDIVHINNLGGVPKVFYSTIDTTDGQDHVTIRLCSYDLREEKISEIYVYDDNINRYSEYKRIIAFILNETYILFQDEYIRYNLADTYKGYFDFEQVLFSVEDKKAVKLRDENLRQNGIFMMKKLTGNLCMIKTGFDILTDRRYELLEKEECPREQMGIINIGQFISDALMINGEVSLERIDMTYLKDTLVNIKVQDSFIIYSKVDLQEKKETVVFYNYELKKYFKATKGNIASFADLSRTYLMGGIPYVRLNGRGEAQFYNLITKRVDLRFDEDVVIEKICGNIIVVAYYARDLIGRKKPMIGVYSHPGKDNILTEKGVYLDTVETADGQLHIFKK